MYRAQEIVEGFLIGDPQDQAKQTQAIVDFQVAVAQLTMTLAEAVERFDNSD